MSKRALYGMVAVALLLAGAAALMRAQAPSQAEQPERWLHVRVEDTGEKGELVRVNLPLSVAEKVLPAVKAHKMENGRIKLSEMRLHDVDLRAVLEAVRGGADGEYVTVESKRKGETVRVAKKAGHLIVEVREQKEGAQVEKVDIKMPMTLVDALLSGPKDELDVLAAIRVLRTLSDTELVTVRDKGNTVRVWVDSKNTSE